MEKTMEKTCCFMGEVEKCSSLAGDQQAAEVQLKEVVKRELIKLIEEEGVTAFISNMTQGFSQWAAEMVVELKPYYPGTTLECVLLYEDQATEWTEYERDCFFTIVQKCDKETMLQGKYTKDCRENGERYMLEQSQFVLAIGKQSQMIRLSQEIQAMGKRGIWIDLDQS